MWSRPICACRGVLTCVCRSVCSLWSEQVSVLVLTVLCRVRRPNQTRLPGACHLPTGHWAGRLSLSGSEGGVRLAQGRAHPHGAQGGCGGILDGPSAPPASPASPGPQSTVGSCRGSRPAPGSQNKPLQLVGAGVGAEWALWHSAGSWEEPGGGVWPLWGAGSRELGALLPLPSTGWNSDARARCRGCGQPLAGCLVSSLGLSSWPPVVGEAGPGRLRGVKVDRRTPAQQCLVNHCPARPLSPPPLHLPPPPGAAPGLPDACPQSPRARRGLRDPHGGPSWCATLRG